MLTDHGPRPSPRSRRMVLLAGTSAVLALATGCSTPPGPADQRADVLAVADHVRGLLEESDGLAGVHVVDDGAGAVPCAPDGERYRRLEIGLADLSESTFAGVADDDEDDLVDARLDRLGGTVSGAVATNPVAPRYFDRGWDVATDEAVPRQQLYYGDEGPGRGASLTVDLVPLEDGWFQVRLEASTTCA